MTSTLTRFPTPFFFMEGQHMSRVVTPPMQQPVPNPVVKIPQEKIAKRAYEKWCHRGCPHGSDKQDWMEAEAELRAEYLKGTSTTTTTRR
jgi:hypothetical protein